MKDWMDKTIPKVMDGLSSCWTCPHGAHTQKGINLAGQQAVHEVLNDLIFVLFPGCHGHEALGEELLEQHLAVRLREVVLKLKTQAHHALEYQCTFEKCDDCNDCEEQAEAAVRYVVESLPDLQSMLQDDIRAAYEGDPAAQSTMEVVMSYPGVQAMIVHRLAHLLYEKRIPMIPRVMSEHAHSKTGIDIHPGATIGKGFFIDHGTGVVIGETCTIGDNVKLYMGVTLGALSFPKDADGNPVKGVKRHPNVGNNVIIYAGATILGGDTSIGDGSVIGGNVWLTHSVPENSMVYNHQPRPLVKAADGTWHTADGPWDDVGGGI